MMKPSHADRRPSVALRGTFLYRCVSLLGVGGVSLALCGCAETQGVKSANLNQKLPDPDAAFMKRVERDPFPNAHAVPTSTAGARAKSKEPAR